MAQDEWVGKEMTRIYDLVNVETKPKFLCLPYTKQRKFFTEKELFKEKWEWRIEQKEGFLTALAIVIKKDLTMSIIKHANRLKVHEKTVRTTIKQDLSWDLDPLDYAI